MKILSFGGSTSSSSINRQLANHAAGLVPSAEVTDLDLRQFDLPLYSSDEEEANGVPQAAQDFKTLIESHDAIVVSLAEHNGSYSAAFKNLYDWTSRINVKVWSDKPMLLMATSPGGRGGATVLETAKATFPRMGADLRATFSLPTFYENFSTEEGVIHPEFKAALDEAIAAFSA
ncbi:MAG: NAD(P)H-dependent oxidoreductase [Verrucomicrobiales bacterium]|nr:NAD(P)H-dependent oxidoreductase [Verrucomicrobiales bacterium]